MGLIPQQTRDGNAYGVGGQTVFAELADNPLLEYEKPYGTAEDGSAEDKQQFPREGSYFLVTDEAQA